MTTINIKESQNFSMMKNLISNIQKTIRDVYNENDYLSDIDLAYKFLCGIKRMPIKDIKKDFNTIAKTGMNHLFRNHKGKDQIYRNRNIPEVLVSDLTLRTLELLDQMILYTDVDTGVCDAGFIEGYPLIEAGEYDFSKVFTNEIKGKHPVISGKITDVKVRTSGKKKFAYLKVSDYKGQMITVLVSSYFYSQYENDLKNCKGKYLGLTGKVVFDKYLNSNIIRAYDLDIVKGYHIPRVPIKSYNN